LYADVLRLSHPAEPHSGCHEIYGLYITSAICLGEYGNLAIWQPTGTVDLSAHGVLLPLQVSKNFKKYYQKFIIIINL